MLLRDLAPGIRGMLWMNEAFRKLGFLPTEIFPEIAMDMITQKLSVFMKIMRDGEELFTATIAPLWFEPAEFFGLWREACLLWNTATDAELDEIWAAEPRETFQALAMALHMKGVRMPDVDARINSQKN